MEQKVNFQQGMDIDPDDFNNVQTYTENAIDHIVGDGISSGQRYAGFNVTKSSVTAVLIDIGRLYSGGKVYGQSSQTTQDFVARLPTVSQIMVSVVVSGVEQDTNVTPREFLINADTGASQPQAVAMTHARLATVGFVYSAEQPNAAAPVLQAGLTKVADILLTTGGVSTITMNGATALPSVDGLNTRTTALETWRAAVDPQIGAITTQISGITGQLSNLGNQQMVYSVAASVAQINLALKLPQSYVNYRSLNFFDDTYSNKATAGYSALCSEGLRFPPANTNVTAATVFNPYDASVKVTAAGLMLPTYTEYVRRIVAGGVAYIALSQYAYQTYNTTTLSVSGSRVRYGQQFEVSTGSSFYLSGQYLGQQYGAAYGAASIFLLNGQSYQLTQTGEVDADGHAIVRLQMFWADTNSSPYWNRVNTTQSLQAYAWVETFVQPNDGWLTALSARVAIAPNDNSLLYVGICKTVNGQPDLTQMLCMNSAQSNYWTPTAGLGYNKLPMTPTFLQGGERYGYVLMTGGNYAVQSVQTGTSPTTGTLFYGLNGGIWQNDPNNHVMFDAWFAGFTQNTTVVNLTQLSLAGGISTIDIIAGQVVPASCSLTYQVQVNGVWQPLQSTATSFLAGLPPLLPLQAVFTGTSDVQPALNLGASQITVSRPATSGYWVSQPATLNAGSKNITLKFDLTNFNPQIHTFSPTLLTGTNFTTVSQPASIVYAASGTNTMTASVTFSLAATVTTYETAIAYTTVDATRLYVINDVTEVAQ